MDSPRLCPTCRLEVDENELRCPRDGTPLELERAQLIDPLLGIWIGEYRIQERIGSGGMGFVYRAVQPEIGKQVAVKILRPEIAEDPEQMQRLLAEARAVTAIRHRGIIDVFSFGRLPDGRQYLVMELLEGVTLEQVLESGKRLPIPDVIGVLDEVLSALAAAHAAGVVHRDLKPSNIFLTAQSDGSSVVKVLDFGLAKRGAPGKSSPQTRVSLMVGTPEYMAPEQARGEPVGPAADLYSLGVLCYQLLAGVLPFNGGSPIEIVLQHLDKAPPPLSQHAPEVPVELQSLVLSLLAKAPSHRPQRAEEVRHALRKLELPGVVLPPIALSGATALRTSGIAAIPAFAPGSQAPTPPVPTPSGLAKTFLHRRPFTGKVALAGAVLVMGGAAVVVGLSRSGAETGSTIAAPSAAGQRPASETPPQPAHAVEPGPTPAQMPVRPANAVEPPKPQDRSDVAETALRRKLANGELRRDDKPPDAAGPAARLGNPTPASPAPRPEEPSAEAKSSHPTRSTHHRTHRLHQDEAEPATPSAEALLRRIDRLTSRLEDAAGRKDPDPLAMALLEQARKDVRAGPAAPERERIERRLDVIETRFLPH